MIVHCFHSDACIAASHQDSLTQAGEGQVSRCVYEAYAACCLHVVSRMTKKTYQLWIILLNKVLNTILKAHILILVIFLLFHILF